MTVEKMVRIGDIDFVRFTEVKRTDIDKMKTVSDIKGFKDGERVFFLRHCTVFEEINSDMFDEPKKHSSSFLHQDDCDILSSKLEGAPSEVEAKVFEDFCKMVHFALQFTGEDVEV